LTQVAQNLAVMETVMNLRGSIQCGEFLVGRQLFHVDGQMDGVGLQPV